MIVFMTHCGMHGVMEAIYHGVPMVGMPVFIDQVSFITTERFTDLGNLNFPMDFRLGTIYTTALAASKNDARFKSGHNCLKNNYLTSLI